MPKGKYYADLTTRSEALQTRLAINSQLGARDFDSWVITQLQPELGEYILDIGCGTGKFAIPCSQIVGDKGGVVGLDTSEESLAKLKTESEARGLRITTIHTQMENLAEHINKGIFDAALSSYALYYSEQPEQTISDIHRSLKTHGRLLVVGPDRGNNRELLNFLKPLTNITETSLYNQDFTYKVVIPACRRLFKKVETGYFENPVTFPSAQLLLKYWQSGGYYRPEVEERVQKAVIAYFSENTEFILHKRAVSVLATGVKV